MAPKAKTIRMAIKNCLKNLKAGELEELKDALIVEKEIPTSSVEGQNYLGVTQVIDTTFGDKAHKVVIKLLNDIGCKAKADALKSKTIERPKVSVDKLKKERNPPPPGPDRPRPPTKRQRSLAEAPPESKTRKRPKVSVDNGDPALPETPSGALKTEPSQEALKIAADQKQAKATGNGESKTRKGPKVFVDNGDPALPKTPSGALNTKPSQEALKIEADQKKGKATVKEPEEVEADAVARVRSEGGDPSNERLVLSRFILQFGKYKGQTFKWLLENDVGYAVYVVATHQKERKRKKDQSKLMVHKDSLTRYTKAYRDVMAKVRLYQPSTASRPIQKKQNRSRKKK